MPDFAQRSRESELMDEGGISFAEFHHCLQSLEIINELTLAYRPTLRWIKPWLRQCESLSILDAGCGGGDMLRRIEQQARRLQGRGQGPRSLELIGVDLNPWAQQSAERQCASSQVRYATANIFDFEPQRPIDLVLCSLFTHHLSDQELLRFLRWIDQRARLGWFINDLHRHPLPYHFIKGATRLCSRNRLIRNDAAVSVARAFTRRDWQRLLREAGIEGAQISWHFPFRICVSKSKDGRA